MQCRERFPIEPSSIRAIVIGFVDFSVPADEGTQLLLDLLDRWNPLLAKGIYEAAPEIETGVILDKSMDALIKAVKVQTDKKYPDCDVIVQHGRFEIRRISTGRRAPVSVILVTYLKSEREKTAVVVGDNLTLVPHGLDVERVKEEISASASQLGREPLEDEVVHLDEKAVRRFLLWSHQDCRVIITNKRLIFWDKEKEKYSFEIPMDAMCDAEFDERFTNELVIRLENGKKHEIGIEGKEQLQRLVDQMKQISSSV
jgi:hypothetical protein